MGNIQSCIYLRSNLRLILSHGLGGMKEDLNTLYKAGKLTRRIIV